MCSLTPDAKRLGDVFWVSFTSSFHLLFTASFWCILNVNTKQKCTTTDVNKIFTITNISFYF